MISEEQGGDLYLVNGNMAKLEDAGLAYEAGVLNAETRALKQSEKAVQNE
jgi:hypothetical protein